MKNLSIIFCAAVMALTSCNKDRIDEDANFEPMDEFFTEHKPQEQEFIITSDTGDAPIVGMQGTELYGFRNILQYPSGDTVPLPYSIKLIELYTYGDMVLYEMPTVASEETLESAGEVKIRACHDGNELVLKPAAQYPFKLSTTPPQAGMKVYHGEHPGDKYGDWLLSTDGSAIRVTDKYEVATGKLGWQNIGKKASYEATTNINFKVEGSGGEHIKLFFASKDEHALLQGSNLVIPNVPGGKSGTIVAMAKNSKGEFLLFKKEILVTAGLEIDIDFNTVSEAALLSSIKNL